MRDPIENITQLQRKMNDLQLENQLLKNLLDQAGVPYKQQLAALQSVEEKEDYQPDQGKRIIHPNVITSQMANIFFSRFWGRQDVYAKRNENKSNGKASYFPQCENFWKNMCHRKLKTEVPCRKCEYRKYKQLEMKDLLAHLNGESYNASDVIGIYQLYKDENCRFLVFDFDNHEKNAEGNDFANTNDEWIEEVETMRKVCTLNGIEPLVERSRSGRGAHIWIFFEEPISAALARRFGAALLAKGAEQVNLKSFKYYDRMLPAQDKIHEDGIGNLIALPLQGKALREGNSAFIDGNWNAYPNQWEALVNKPRLSQEFLELKMKEWADSIGEFDEKDDTNNREKPWERNRKFLSTEVEGKLSITLANGIYVDSTNLKVSIQNKIRRMAAINNPKYFKNQAIGISNYDTPRWLYNGQDHLSGYIEIPRGLYDELINSAKQANIEYVVEDERQQGKTINVEFAGELREEQKTALEEMAKYDNGILHAATAFGKTVVCSAIIAEKKVNTLILLESSALIDQWKESLEKFLIIDEELPQYKTKTGRIKTRTSLIGRLQGAHDSMAGIVDVAMVGSICKKGEFHQLLNDYGMVIVDECHHAASDTFKKVLKEVKAKYVYGVTATPKRSDGLEKINYMFLGPIRYSYTSKEKAENQGIKHLVYPRFTRVVAPRGVISKKIHPNEAYEILHKSKTRDEQIINDIKECIKEGRTPVVLSKYKDHSEKLYSQLKEVADNVFLMTGNNSKKEHKHILEELSKVDDKESLILVATGSLIGEGFDFPRLDTLFVAMPVSFRSVVEQYAGRLNRDYEGKEDVIVYDYVDSHISMFDNMYAKRLKAYKQIGYTVCTGIKGEKQVANAIYDSENYVEIYYRDLKEASENIIISSPVISGSKVYELMEMLKEKQQQGLQITIVTWEPDNYGFGDSAFWMQLHDELQSNGFYIKTVEETCEHFAIIDQEIVWYGSINLLGNAKNEDSMMRVKSNVVATELMELTFGGE